MSALQVFHSASFLNTEKKTELPDKGKVKNKIVLVQTVGFLFETLQSWAQSQIQVSGKALLEGIL